MFFLLAMLIVSLVLLSMQYAATSNKIEYGGATQITCGIASLVSGSTRESATVANTSSKYFDYEVSLTFTLASGSPTTAATGVNVYANASNDGTLWPILQLSSGAIKATGAGDASIGALGTGINMPLIGTFNIQSTSSSAERTFRTQPYSVAAGFNGILPSAFSIMIENKCVVAFSTSTVTTANYLQANGIFTTSGN